MTSVPTIKIGTRKSALARVQSDGIHAALEKLGVRCEIVEVVSSGDKDHTTPLYQLDAGSPGLFTKQLEAALLDRTVDLAVHSLKDLPTLQPSGLVVTAVPVREDAADVLLINKEKFTKDAVWNLPPGAVVGTSSLRREALLLSKRPDLKVVPVRGNVPTRARMPLEGKVDAVVLAEAGLHRLGLDLSAVAKVTLPADEFIAAPGQGALALETRTDCPPHLRAALAKLHDAGAETETRIERTILRELEGGCTLPLGVRCLVRADKFVLRAFLGVTKQGTTRDWISFHHFDIEESDAENLIRKTVRHFQSILKQANPNRSMKPHNA